MEGVGFCMFISHLCCISTLPSYSKSRTQANGAATLWSIVLIRAEEEKKVTYMLALKVSTQKWSISLLSPFHYPRKVTCPLPHTHTHQLHNLTCQKERMELEYFWKNWWTQKGCKQRNEIVTVVALWRMYWDGVLENGSLGARRWCPGPGCQWWS